MSENGEKQSSPAEASGEFYFRLTSRSAGVVLMPTLQEQDFFTELAAGHSGPPIPESKRVYFQTRLRNRLFDYIVGRFIREQKRGLTKAALARRIGKSPEVINRWLGSPSNLETDSISDLLLGIGAEELTPQSESLLNQKPRNWTPAAWIIDDPAQYRPKIEISQSRSTGNTVNLPLLKKAS
jgi:hypothetical protein